MPSALFPPATWPSATWPIFNLGICVATWQVIPGRYDVNSRNAPALHDARFSALLQHGLCPKQFCVRRVRRVRRAWPAGCRLALSSRRASLSFHFFHFRAFIHSDNRYSYHEPLACPDDSPRRPRWPRSCPRYVCMDL